MHSYYVSDNMSELCDMCTFIKEYNVYAFISNPVDKANVIRLISQLKKQRFK